MRPTARDYQEALQNPDSCFRDPDLRAGRPECDRFGLPKAISGNFASVFTIRTRDGKRCAVRCFVRYFDDQRQRYDAISDFLASVDASWKVHFAFLEEGIRIRGEWSPILKMEWIEAQPISRYVAAQLSHPEKIVALAEDFRTVVGDLSARGAAHGDLQHGNLLVTAEGTVKLIDYDGMYVPALTGRAGHEVGHRNYQHPLRTDRDFGPEVDNFSAWVIYLSLLATAADPTLWSRLGGGEEQLLFSSQDYAEPDLGAAMRALALNASSDLRGMVDTMKANIRASPGRVPALTELSVAVASEAGTGSGQVFTGSTHPGWMKSHIPAIEALMFPRKRLQSGASWALFVLTAVAAPLLAVGFGAVFAIVVAAVALSGWLATLWIAFRRSPELHLRAEHQHRLHVAERDRRECGKGKQRSERALAKVTQSENKLRSSHERDATARAKRHQSELQRVRQNTQQQLARIEGERNDAVSSQQSEIAAMLQVAQRTIYAQEMSRFRISQSGAHGVGPALSRALSAFGINTASDFSGTGRLMQVPGIGPAKATALEAWRQGVEQHVRRKLPTSLSQSERGSIEARHRDRIRGLDHQVRQTSDAGARDLAGASARHQNEEAAAVKEAQAALLRVTANRPQVMADLQQAVAALQQSEVALARCQRDLVPFRAITFRRFIYAAARG